MGRVDGQVPEEKLRKFMKRMPFIRALTKETLATSEDRADVLGAAGQGNEDAIDQLLSARADVNTTESDTGCTALYMAAQNGNAKVVCMLLVARADVDKSRADNG